MVGFGLAELILLLTMGGSVPAATSVLYANPVVLLSLSALSRSVPAGAAAWLTGARSSVVSGPTAIIAPVPPVAGPPTP